MKPDLEMEILMYLNYLAKPFLAVKTLFLTPKGLTIALPTIAGVAALSNETKAWYFLLLVYGIDFITGVMASYHVNFKKEKEKKSYQKILESNLLIRILFKVEFFIGNISSQKLRKSFIKAVGYALFILLFYAVQHLFKIKTWTFESISNLEWNLTLAAQASCIGAEIWSILFENFKALGLDLVKIVTNMSKTYREVKKEIKEDSE